MQHDAKLYAAHGVHTLYHSGVCMVYAWCVHYAILCKATGHKQLV